MNYTQCEKHGIQYTDHTYKVRTGRELQRGHKNTRFKYIDHMCNQELKISRMRCMKIWHSIFRSLVRSRAGTELYRAHRNT